MGNEIAGFGEFACFFSPPVILKFEATACVA
jgi:hypothetical protein